MQGFSDRAGVRLLGAWLLGLSLAACASPADAPPPITVTVSPSGIVSLSVGDTITVRGQVQNAAGTGVTYATSNAAVAGVDAASGLVRALGPGEAQITATSVDEPSAKATLQLRVQDRPSSVAINRIVNAAGTLVDPANAQGGIFVQLALELGSATRLEVLLDTVVVCQRSYTATLADRAETAATIAAATAAAGSIPDSCSIDTGVFDAATGAAKFSNGPAVISARLLGPEGRVRANANGYSLTLRNPARIVTEVAAARQATDSTGLRWNDGDVTVSVLPVVYDRSVGIARADVIYGTPGSGGHILTDTEAPFRVTLLENGPLKGVTDANFRLVVRTVTTQGEVGPGLTTTAARYDNAPPIPGTLQARDWIGAETPFVQTYDATAETDQGVGRVRVRFFAGDPILSDTALISRGSEVARGSDLTQSTGAYRVAALVCDALDNCVPAPGFQFRVDLTPPTIDAVSLKDRGVNPTGSLILTLGEQLSGLDARPVEALVRSLDNSAATSPCGPEVDAVNLPGRLGTGGACIPDTVGSQLPIPTVAAGYYTYIATPFDRAGNRGPTVTRSVLIDRTRPEITSVFVPPQLLPGDEASFTATASDDLDLTDLAFRLVFPTGGGGAPLALPFDTVSTPVGAAFDAVLTTQATRVAKFPVIRTLTSGAGGGRVTVLLDSVQVQAVDAAGLTASTSRYLAPGATTVVDPFPTITGVPQTTVDAPLVCTGGCQPSERASVRIEMRVTGTREIKTTPFARVYFYRRDPTTGTVVLLGFLSGDRGNGDFSGVPTIFTYSFPYAPAAGLTGRYDLFAVGVTSSGNALRNDPQRVEFVQH